MALPPSFTAAGYVLPNMLTPLTRGRRLKRLLIGTEGPSNTGKTEFPMTAPGPGIYLCLDRGFEAALDNPEPPETRRNDYAFKVIPVPLPLQQNKSGYETYWRDFLNEYRKALDNKDCRTVVVDGDSDGFELQTLAEFGKNIQIPPILRTGLNAARRSYIAHSFDSGKIVFHTNKLKKKYETVYNVDGSPKVGTDGKEIREWDGVTLERQGFWDHDYLYQLQLGHLYRPARINSVTKKEVPQEWGVRILSCKAQPALKGQELWGSDCNFSTLVQLVYPQIELADWGF